MKTRRGGLWKASLVCALASGLVILLGPAPIAQAATINVGCDVMELIGAINTANLDGELDVIELASGCTYSFTQVDNASAYQTGNALPKIASDIQMVGNGATLERADTAPAMRILEVARHPQYAQGEHNEFSLSNVTVRGGYAFLGAGLVSDDFLSISNSTFTDNAAEWSGGAVQNHSKALLSDVSLMHNSAAIGAGFFNGNDGSPDMGATLNRVTIAHNQAFLAAGVFNEVFSGGQPRTLYLANATIYDNAAGGWGGGVMNREGSFVYITNSTLSDNTVGIYNESTVVLKNTIVANSTTGPDCIGGVTDGGNNLDSDGSCGVGPAKKVKLDPAGLKDNGGPTQTIALLPTSPAVDAGHDAVCAAEPVDGVDQHGVQRPQGTHCDIGAFELEAQYLRFADLSIVQTGKAKASQIMLTLTVANGGPNAARQVVVKDVLAKGLRFESAETGKGSCSYRAPQRTLECRLGKVAKGTQVKIEVIAIATRETATFENTATVNTVTPDADLTNNTATGGLP